MDDDVERLPNDFQWLLALRDAIETDSVFEPILRPQDSGKEFTPREQVLPARVIRDALQTTAAIFGSRLRIRGATISGRLDLREVHVHSGLFITESRFEQTPLFSFSRLPTLDLSDSSVPGLKMDEAKVEGNCRLAGLKSHGDITMHGMKVAGDLILTGAQVSGALIMEKANVSGNAVMPNVHVTEGIWASGIWISEVLDLSSATLGGSPSALSLHEAHVSSIYLKNVDTGGPLDITDISTSVLDLSDATIQADEGSYSLRMRGTHVRHLSQGGLVIAGGRDRLDEKALELLAGVHVSSLHKVIDAGVAVIGLWPLLLPCGLILYSFTALPTAVTGEGNVNTVSLALMIAVITGFASCAVLELAKRLVRLRGWYQWPKFQKWLRDRLGSRREGKRAYIDFVLLAGVGQRQNVYPASQQARSVGSRHLAAELALFDLPIDQLAAQIAVVSETVINSPKRHRGLYRALVGIGSAMGESPKDAYLDDSQRARASVDQVQITMTDGWRRMLAGASASLSGFLGLIFAQYYDGNGLDDRLTVLMATFIGGFVSWIVRDIAAAIEHRRS